MSAATVGERLRLAQLKTRIPQRSSQLIVRDRLRERLDAAVNRAAVTLVQAPPGYGKTSLLSQWAAGRETDAVAWLSAAAADDDPATLLAYLVESLEHAGVGIDNSTRCAIADRLVSRPSIVAQALANSIVAHPRRVILCIDDIHLISEHSSIDCVSTLIENTCPAFRIVLTTRETPPILMGRLRAYGDLAEFSAEDLRFDKQEIVDFFTVSGPVDLSADEVDVIEQRTEGWAVGLRMTSMVLAEQPERAEMLASLTGGRRQLTDFFGEEILARQPPALQKFLLQTSILERFCGDICIAVSGVRDAQRWIEDAESKGLFVLPLDQNRTWYRYHYLFAQFLQRKLRDLHRDEVPRLHRAACDWLLDAGVPLEAIEHALAAGDAQRAGEILEAQCDHLFSKNEQPTVIRLAARLPVEIRNRLPKVLLLLAWRLMCAWRLQEAEDLLRVCRQRIAELRSTPGEDPAAIELIESYLLHRELNIAIFRDDAVLAQQHAEAILARFPQLSAYLKASVYHDLMDAQRGQLNLTQLDRIATVTRELIDIARSEHSHVFHASVMGSAYFAAGRTQDAIRVLSHGMAVARRLSGHGDALVSVAAVSLSAVLYERNDLDGARRLVERYAAPAATLGLVEQLIAGWLTQAKICWLDGQRERAIQVLKDARTFGAARGFERLTSLVEAELVRLYLLGGSLNDAIAVRPDLAGVRTPELVMPRRHPTLRAVAHAEIWARIAIAHGRITPASTVIRHWRRLLANTLAAPLIVQWELLYARALFLDGNQSQALRAVDQAIARAEPGRLFRLFLDEGGVIATLLERVADKKAANVSDCGAFATQLFAEVRRAAGKDVASVGEAPDDTGLLASLTPRELEVLKIAASRISNREIGEALGLTEGSVKWYLQRVYDKIGVRRRSEAARKAKQFGLIA